MPNIVLKRFMIFNSSDGQDEGCERDKLLYHWSKDAPNNCIDLTEQIDDICLCDASVAASVRLDCKPLEPDLPDIMDGAERLNLADNDDNIGVTTTGSSSRMNSRSLVLTFDTTLILIAEVEPDQSIWMAAHVATSNNSTETNDTSVPSANSETSTTISNSHQHIDPSCIPVAAIERAINNIYARFCLINGTFRMIIDETNSNDNDGGDRILNSEKIRTRIRTICQDYFNAVLPEIHLNSIISNVASLYNYIVYLELNPMTLMKVNSFINHLVCINAIQIRHTLVIFNDQLLWSSLNMYDTRLVYNYLVAVLVRNALQEELSREIDKVRRIKEEMPIYLTDKFDELNDFEESLLPGIGEDFHPLASSPERREEDENTTTRKLEKFYLTVFRSSNNMTVGLIFKDPNQFDLIQKCEQILTSDTRLGVIPLASLAQSVGQNFLKTNSLQSSPSSNQSNFSQQIAGSSSSISLNVKRRQSYGTSSFIKSSINTDQKYLSLDRLNVSVSWSLNMDALGKEHHVLLGPHDGGSPEMPSGSKKLRLIRNLLELEPELQEIKRQTGSQVEEFFGKTTSDTWLTVSNSNHRTIYSINKMRNAGLSEAQQCAMSLKATLTSNRP